jgi:tetratricopeptide (TPR) repeat protein
MPSKKTKKIKIVSVGESAARETAKRTGPRAMIYLYWVAIALFVGAACYMLYVKKNGAAKDNVEIVDAPMPSEEPLDSASDESAAYRDMGKRKLLDGDTVGALNDFTTAVEKNPDEPLNYVYRGEVLMTGSNFEAAIADFDAAARIDPGETAAYYDRALADIKLERLDDAKGDLDRALDAADYDGSSTISAHDIYAKRAQVNLWLRDWDAADGDYTAAIAKNTGELDWTDYTGRAEARTNNGDYERAIADYTSAVTIISDRIQKTPEEKTRENMSRQAMGYFEKSGALRVKLGQMDLALQDLQAAHTLALALGDEDNRIRLQILMSSIR